MGRQVRPGSKPGGGTLYIAGHLGAVEIRYVMAGPIHMRNTLQV